MARSCLIARAVGPADAWAAGLIGGPKGQHQRALLVHWNGVAWRRVTLPGPAAGRLGGNVGFVFAAADGAGGVWALTGSLGSADPGAARVWHYARRGWSGPQPVSPPWLLFGLDWVPRTRSVWGVAGSPGLVQGLIVLHGPAPR